MKYYPFFNQDPGDGGGTPPAPPADPNNPAGNTPPANPNEPPTPPEQFNIYKELSLKFGEVEGEFEPTPEGLTSFVEVLRNKAVTSYQSELAEKAPDAFKAVQYALMGGDIRDLYKPESTFPFKSAPADNDVASQKELVIYDLMKKGIDKDDAEAIVARHIDKNTLSKTAGEVFNRHKDAEKAYQQSLIEKREADIKAQAEADKRLLTGLNDKLGSGKIGKFGISKEDSPKFLEFATKAIVRDGQGGYSIALPIANDTLDNTLSALYFLFRGGDLSKYVQQAATTQNINDLFNRSPKAPDKPAGQNNSWDFFKQ